MSRTGNPTSKLMAQDIEALRQLGGPLVVKVQRHQLGGGHEYLAYWEGMTIDELAGPIEQKLFDYAGGGDYVLSIYTPDERTKPKHSYQLTVPGEPKVPKRFQDPPAQPPFNPFAPYSGFPGVGLVQPLGAPNSPYTPNPYGGLMPSYNPYLPGLGMGGQQQPTQPAGTDPGAQWGHMMTTMVQMDQMRSHRRAEQQQEWEDQERRERLRREQERLDRVTDPSLTVNKPTGPSPEVEALKATLAAMQAQLQRTDSDTRLEQIRAETKAAEERSRQERQAAEERMRQERQADKERFERSLEEQRRAAEQTRREADEKFARVVESLRAAKDTPGNEEARLKAEESRREEERRRWEEERRRDEERWRAELQRRDEAREREEKHWREEQERRREDQKMAAEREQQRREEDQRRRDEEIRRAEQLETRRREDEQRKMEAERLRREDAREDEQRRMEAERLRREDDLRRTEADRRREEEQRQRELEARQAMQADQTRRSEEMTRILLEATKKDDGALVNAMTGIFSNTLEGQRSASAGMFEALKTVMEATKDANQLPSWMERVLLNQTTRSDEMNAVSQSAGQLMSVAFGAMGQSMQQMGQMMGGQENPWVRIAEGLFREVGAIGEALVGRGLGTGEGQPGEALPDRRLIEPSPQHPALPAGALSGGPTEEEIAAAEAIPASEGAIGEVEPVSAAQIVATRIRQLQRAIRAGMGAAEAARALVEIGFVETAYAGEVPPPLDQLPDSPAEVIATLFGDYLSKYGDDGVAYMQTMVEWVERFVAEGGVAGEGEEEEEATEDEEEEEEAPRVFGEEDEEAATAGPTNGRPRPKLRVVYPEVIIPSGEVIAVAPATPVKPKVVAEAPAKTPKAAAAPEAEAKAPPTPTAEPTPEVQAKPAVQTEPAEPVRRKPGRPRKTEAGSGKAAKRKPGRLRKVKTAPKPEAPADTPEA